MGDRERLHRLRLNRFCDNTLRYAFSLIELSIVLIIIGLLVAGVTGGKYLIDSARSRALINELREYERAVWTFRAARDRFPGDVMNYGTFGLLSNYYSSTCNACPKPYYAYKKTDFSAPFNTGSFIPSAYSAPFVDLYAEGIIDFKPLGNAATADKNSTTKGVPNLKSVSSTYIYFHCTDNKNDLYYTKIPGAGLWWLTGTYSLGNNKEALILNNSQNALEPKILKQVDLKIDDGDYWNGLVRSLCHGKKGANGLDNGYTDYDYAIENNKKCSSLFYAI